MVNLTWFDEYKEGLSKSGRYETMRQAVWMFLCRVDKRSSVIVETGTIRMKDDWGAGMSTLILGATAARYEHTLYTVDINPEALAVCREETKMFENFINYVEEDSVSFLEKFTGKIDLLYLDSMDCPEYDEVGSDRLLASQLHQLKEMKVALPKLSADPVILLDDNEFPNGGKTLLTKTFLQSKGFVEVARGKQSLWIKA
jgi:SAM-dependent methyltransferase